MRRFQLPLLGSNQDSPDPESGVLPVTPRGSGRSRVQTIGYSLSATPQNQPSVGGPRNGASLEKAHSQSPTANSVYGAEGDRTPDLLIANEALSQLSYSPNVASVPANVPSVPGMKDGKSTG